MRTIAAAIRFIVYSNLFIALCAAAYTAKTSLLLYGSNGSLSVNGIVFCATLLLYCFHRINKKKFLTLYENAEERNNWMSLHKSVYHTLIPVSVALLCVQLFFMPPRMWLVFVPAGIVGLGYTYPIVPARGGWKRLRDIYWLKPVWIALAFSWLTTFLPVVYAESVSSVIKPEVLFIFFRGFLFIFVLCIPFDIRDRAFDERRGVYTIPVRLGEKKSIYLSIILLLFFVVLLVIQLLYFGLNTHIAFALFISCILTAAILPLGKAGKPALMYPLLYDGAMLVQWVLIVVSLHI